MYPKDFDKDDIFISELMQEIKKAGVLGPAEFFTDELKMIRRYNMANNIPPLVGYKEAAEIVGVDHKSLAVYIKRGKNNWDKFPEPITRLASGPVWRKSDIVKFKNQLKPAE